VVVRGAYINSDFRVVKKNAWRVAGRTGRLARMETARIPFALELLAGDSLGTAFARPVSKAKKQLLI